MKIIAIIALLLFSSCKRFTKKKFDKVKDVTITRVEFLEYPKLRINKDGTMGYPVLVDVPGEWDFKNKVVTLHKRTVYVKITPLTLHKHNERYFKEGEDQSCFEFPVKELTGWVGDSTFVPIERCVESEKVPFDQARKRKIWFATNFRWRVEVE